MQRKVQVEDKASKRTLGEQNPWNSSAGVFKSQVLVAADVDPCCLARMWQQIPAATFFMCLGHHSLVWCVDLSLLSRTWTALNFSFPKSCIQNINLAAVTWRVKYVLSPRVSQTKVKHNIVPFSVKWEIRHVATVMWLFVSPQPEVGWTHMETKPQFPVPSRAKHQKERQKDKKKESLECL